MLISFSLNLYACLFLYHSLLISSSASLVLCVGGGGGAGGAGVPGLHRPGVDPSQPHRPSQQGARATIKQFQIKEDLSEPSAQSVLLEDNTTDFVQICSLNLTLFVRNA